jgi:hypothetical protein
VAAGLGWLRRADQAGPGQPGALRLSATFCYADAGRPVAGHGGLPFLKVGLMSGPILQVPGHLEVVLCGLFNPGAPTRPGRFNQQFRSDRGNSGEASGYCRAFRASWMCGLSFVSANLIRTIRARGKPSGAQPRLTSGSHAAQRSRRPLQGRRGGS